MIYFGYLRGLGCVESKNKTSAKGKSTISHTKTCQLFLAKIEILDLIEFFVDLKNPKIHPDPFSEGLL